MSATHELPLFQQQQYAFAAHIRDPEGSQHPVDVDERRMAIYSELFFNNIEGVLSSAFPVLRSLYEEGAWRSLVRRFFSTHHARTPYFTELPREFIDYLEKSHSPESHDPAFLLELAHYEWVELALSIAEDKMEPSTFDPRGDLLDGIPVLSPLAWPLSYRYPVHRIEPDYCPEEAPAELTHLLVYRGRNDEIAFLELNQVTARVVQLVADNRECSGSALLMQVADELNHPNPQTVIRGGEAIFAELQEAGALLGTRI